MTGPSAVLRMRCALDAVAPAPSWPHGFRVRTWIDSDAADVHALLVDAYRSGGGTVAEFGQWRPAFVGDAEFDASACLIAETDGADARRLAGVVLCWSSGFVKDLAVAADWRRRGLGAALLRAAMDTFRRRGFRAVELKVEADNPSGARRLYERLGFVVTERIPGDGEAPCPNG